jgi:hypothetical protein
MVVGQLVRTRPGAGRCCGWRCAGGTWWSARLIRRIEVM